MNSSVERRALGGAFERISKSFWARTALLVLLTIAAYLPAMHGGFIWDDDVYVTNNPLLTAPDGLRRIWFSFDSPSQYFPLVYTTFRIERALWGLNPLGYHLVNLVLHIANALFVWRLLVRLSIPGAWLAAGIFALHPVQVESVAWITERKNVLMGIFFLLTLLVWITFLDEQTKRRWRFYVLALALCALALFSKATACTLPAALLLILWLQKKPITRERLVQIIPFASLGLLMGLVVVWWERYHQGTRGAQFAVGLLERSLRASHSVWFYVGKLIWPSKLIFIYPRWNVVSADPLAYGWLIAAIGGGVMIYFSRRYIGRGVEVAVAFYLATLSPLLGFIMLYTFRYTFVADHYQYMASIGLIALAAATLSKFAARWRIAAPIEVASAALLFLLLGSLTWRQAHAYQNLETLWNDTLTKNPTCWMAHNNLGVILNKQHRFEEAKAHFETARALNPTDAESEGNIGAALLDQGDLEEAKAHLLVAVRLDPSLAEPHNNLGILLAAEGRLDEAIEHYRRCLELNPGQAEAHNNLGSAFLRQGRLEEAIVEYRKSLEIERGAPEVHYNLGLACAQQGKTEEAIDHFQKALAIKPDYADAHYDLATALLQLGRRDEAVTHLIEVLRIKPDYVEAKQQLRALGVEPAE